jgi:inner membrane protein
MDPVSQGALGASLAQSGKRRGDFALVGGIGCIAGMAPDLDILIRSSTDPLLFLEFHRHFTHSLAFIPIGSLVCALILHRFFRHRFSFGSTYFYCFLGYASHGLLDACTTYGTLLLWPFSDARIAWNNVSVIDPLFTVPVIILVVLAAKRGKRRWAWAAVAWAVAYLMLGAVQMRRAAGVASELAMARGHYPAAVVATPAIASILLWKTIYEYDGRYFVDAVRVGFSSRTYEGSSLEKFDPALHLTWLDPTSTQARDVDRFRRFTKGLLGVDASNPLRLVDMRYSMLPNDVDGLWAISLDPDATGEEHVAFVTNRSVPPGRASALFDMLF